MPSSDKKIGESLQFTAILCPASESSILFVQEYNFAIKGYLKESMVDKSQNMNNSFMNH